MSNVLEKETKYGMISVSDNTIMQVVMGSLEKYRGIMVPASGRGKIVHRRNRNPKNGPVCDIEIGNIKQRLDISIYVVLKFGASIKKTTEAAAEEVRKAVYEATGSDPRRIRIVITGVQSRKTARRNIEVEKFYD